MEGANEGCGSLHFLDESGNEMETLWYPEEIQNMMFDHPGVKYSLDIKKINSNTVAVTAHAITAPVPLEVGIDGLQRTTNEDQQELSYTYNHYPASSLMNNILARKQDTRRISYQGQIISNGTVVSKGTPGETAYIMTGSGLRFYGFSGYDQWTIPQGYTSYYPESYNRDLSTANNRTVYNAVESALLNGTRHEQLYLMDISDLSGTVSASNFKFVDGMGRQWHPKDRDNRWSTLTMTNKQAVECETWSYNSQCSLPSGTKWMLIRIYDGYTDDAQVTCCRIGVTTDDLSFDGTVYQYINNTWQKIPTVVSSLSSSSTNDQVPSAACVYTALGNIESLLSQI